MPDIRFAGLAKTSEGTNKAKIEQLTGFTLQRDGDDWLVRENDPVLLRGPGNVLVTRDEPWELNPSRYKAIGDEYSQRFLNAYFEERLTPPQEPVPIYGEWGIRTPLEERRLNLFLTPTQAVSARLEQDTLPFFLNEMRASSVAPLMAKADLQQAFISISKILALIQYTGLEGTAARISRQQDLDPGLPTSLDIMNYVESLNTMSPAAISLPIQRMGSSLHFMRGKPWFFPRLAIENIYEQLVEEIKPLVDSQVAFFTQNQHIQKRAVHAYFLASVDAVNRLMRYLNDVRTYVDARGVFDPIRMVKAQSVVRLMFADWQSINFTNSRYTQLRMVFAFLDKLANLVAIMQGSKTSEEELAKRLCSRQVGQRISELLRHNFSPRFHSLALLMARTCTATYDRLHQHIGSQPLRGAENEAQRLNYLRTVRNSAHGAFLRSNQFEEVFLAARGSVCAEFNYLPLLLLWGLASDPKRFMQSV
jgi:hypothetical protein